MLATALNAARRLAGGHQSVACERLQLLRCCATAVQDVEAVRAQKLWQKRQLALFTFGKLVGNAPHLATRLPEFKVVRPNTVQRLAMPLIAEGKDVVLAAPTGYGKTLAYMLPALSRVNPKRPDLQVLVVAPTRELVVQLHALCHKLVGMGKANKKDNAIRVAKLVGSGTGRGTSVGLGATLGSAPHVVIATPRIINNLVRDQLLDLSQLRTVVLDEADTLMENPDHQRRIDRFLKPARRRQDAQFVFVSASPSDDMLRGAFPWFNRATPPVHVRVEPDAALSDAVKHYVLRVDSEAAKLAASLALFRYRRMIHGAFSPPRCALLFSNSFAPVPALRDALREARIEVGVLHGGDVSDGGKKDRSKVVRSIETGRLQACLCSDVLARGMDLRHLTHVINFDLPASFREYMHRAGRVGRYRDDGAAVSLTKGTVVSLATAQEEATLRQWAEEHGLQMQFAVDGSEGAAQLPDDIVV